LANGDSWIQQSDNYDKNGDQSIGIVINEIGDKFDSVLEVGAGTGRLIGNLSNNFASVKYFSLDINLELSRYVSKKYPRVEVACGEIINLPFISKSFDLVYTFQVLQHVEPAEIDQALRELCRVAKKEVWLWESTGKKHNQNNYPCGAKMHNCHNGSWVWNIDKMLNCYEVKSCGFKKLLLYKIKL